MPHSRSSCLNSRIIMHVRLLVNHKAPPPAVPRASLVILLATASQFNLPEWPIFIILGIDELMDMARTSVNVMGNCLASVVMARWEGEFGKEKPSAVVQESLG